MNVALGIDACKKGWFYVRFDGDAGTFGASETVAEILRAAPADAEVLIDIPIGLKQRGKAERQCDLDARALLRPRRHASVFPVPCRAAVRASSYDEATQKNRRITGRGLSRQSWNIVPKIREVDELMRTTQGLRHRMREAHPEVLFAGLAGGPMSHPKHTREGFAERMTILKLFDPGVTTLVASAFLAHGGYDAARDDIVDAFVLAWCARQPERLRTLPESPPEDPAGLPMQMVYLPR